MRFIHNLNFRMYGLIYNWGAADGVCRSADERISNPWVILEFVSPGKSSTKLTARRRSGPGTTSAHDMSRLPWDWISHHQTYLMHTSFRCYTQIRPWFNFQETPLFICIGLWSVKEHRVGKLKVLWDVCMWMLREVNDATRSERSDIDVSSK